MPRDYIKIDANLSTADLASELINTIELLKNTYNQAKQTLGHILHNTDAGVWLDVELHYGLAPGKGETTYIHINNIVGTMEGTMQSNLRQVYETMGR
jgi:hypothetical protein